MLPMLFTPVDCRGHLATQTANQFYVMDMDRHSQLRGRVGGSLESQVRKRLIRFGVADGDSKDGFINKVNLFRLLVEEGTYC